MTVREADPEVIARFISRHGHVVRLAGPYSPCCINPGCQARMVVLPSGEISGTLHTQPCPFVVPEKSKKRG